MLKPSDCCFMCCLPLTEEQFKLDKENLFKHFVREHLPKNKPSEYKQGTLWNVYKEEVVNPYHKLKKQFCQFGFSFMELVTFDDFINSIELHHVNILFSHCKTGEKEAIEFYDKLVYQNEFIDSIPFNYNKVIDLSVCKPEHIALALKDQRRTAIVKSSNKPISFMYWLYFYGITFEIIYKQKVEYYSNALELSITKLNSKKK